MLFRSLTALVCYTSYGFSLSHLEQWQFNLPIHNICWRNFIHAVSYWDMAKQFCGIRDYGMCFSGYPKMDVFFESVKNTSINKLWKNPGGKKIIWAPHHSVQEDPHTATFEQNYRFFLEYARAHSKETSWAVKPHPLLAISAVKAGIFQSEEEWEQYLFEWDSLPNAVVVNGQYDELFKTSDCMILDSVSFKAIRTNSFPSKVNCEPQIGRAHV